jgi:hypothetical protein
MLMNSSFFIEKNLLSPILEQLPALLNVFIIIFFILYSAYRLRSTRHFLSDKSVPVKHSVILTPSYSSYHHMLYEKKNKKTFKTQQQWDYFLIWNQKYLHQLYKMSIFFHPLTPLSKKPHFISIFSCMNVMHTKKKNDPIKSLPQKTIDDHTWKILARTKKMIHLKKVKTSQKKEILYAVDPQTMKVFSHVELLDFHYQITDFMGFSDWMKTSYPFILFHRYKENKIMVWNVSQKHEQSKAKMFNEQPSKNIYEWLFPRSSNIESNFFTPILWLMNKKDLNEKEIIIFQKEFKSTKKIFPIDMLWKSMIQHHQWCLIQTPHHFLTPFSPYLSWDIFYIPDENNSLNYSVLWINKITQTMHIWLLYP